jgi:hypothetical protein
MMLSASRKAMRLAIVSVADSAGTLKTSGSISRNHGDGNQMSERELVNIDNVASSPQGEELDLNIRLRGTKPSQLSIVVNGADEEERPRRRRWRWTKWFGAIMLVSTFVLRPIIGIGKLLQ